MGAEISKRYSSYISPMKVFKLLLNFLLKVLHKNVFGIANVGPYRSEKFKTLPLKIAVKCPDFSPMLLTNLRWGFSKF